MLSMPGAPLLARTSGCCNPVLGRFSQPDPRQELNRYVYAGNDPAGDSDLRVVPSGDSLLSVTTPDRKYVYRVDLVAACPHIGVLVLSMVSDDDSVFAALQAGARGYLLKGARQAEVVRAVRAVASGEAIFAEIATRLIGYFATPPSAHPSGADGG